MSQISAKRRVAYAAIMVAAVVSSAYCISVMFKTPLAEMPDTEEEALLFVCDKCSAPQMLTPRQMAKLMAEAAAPHGDDRAEAATSARRLVLPCTKCKELALMRGDLCPKCHNPFLPTPLEGGTRFMCEACQKQQVASQLPPPD